MPGKQSHPSQDQIRLGIDLFESFLKNIDRVDRILFRYFSREQTGIVQTKLRAFHNNPETASLTTADWDYASLLLRTMALSFKNFPDLAAREDLDIVYAAVDAIADYAYDGPELPAIAGKGSSYGL
jgi:hypothetical protein